MLMAFFALSFGLSWGLLAAFLAWRAPIEALFGPMGYTNPLFVLAVYAPAIAGAVRRLAAARRAPASAASCAGSACGACPGRGGRCSSSACPR
ncbi:MAG: hypothetical protein MZW92_41175 [Comamonadaceae bacterium]|nr:hypothetical protein [Comamonadaceae bacterium]